MNDNPLVTPPKGKAPDGPTCKPVWASARKDLVGTALGSSRIWFTLADGIITEVYHPRIDIPQIRDLGFIVGDGHGFWVEIKTLNSYSVEWTETDIPAAVVTHRHPRFTLSLRVCTDPYRDVLLTNFRLQGEAGLTLYALLTPRLGENADSNLAWADQWNGETLLWAEQGPFGLALLARELDGHSGMRKTSVGMVGASDGWQDFNHNGCMAWSYVEAGPGEVALTAALPNEGTLALGLSSSKESAATLAASSLAAGFAWAWNEYLAGWRRWRAGQDWRTPLSARLTSDSFALLCRSASVLKVHEDRTYQGALVASMAVPWGEASESRGGYHLVWCRDLVESAGALIALGAVDEARNVLAYLIATQQADGHWLQNQWLGGKPFWQGIQLDEAAFPVLLASLLDERNALGDVPVRDMIARALGFIAREGPSTGQDRWEEDAGVNTFTIAAAIAALVEGAAFLDAKPAAAAVMLADDWNARIEEWCWAQNTSLSMQLGVAGYYLRAAPGDVLIHAGAKAECLRIKNRDCDADLPADEQLATDFLQLVRYGLRSARDEKILSSVQAVDRLLKCDTPSGPVWHRYNGDGYGENLDGSAFDGTGQGRGWPLLTGERGHYALLAGDDARPYLAAMAAMTGVGGLLPEQVWDAAPIPELRLEPGKPSGSAMPLVWAHGEFIKLCLSLDAGRPVDMPSRTWRRYGGMRPKLDYVLWRFRNRPQALPEGRELRFFLHRPATVHWSVDGWQETRNTDSEDWGLGHIASLPTTALMPGDTITFTFHWQDDGQWQGEDFQLQVSGAN
ncbi:MAG TPA: glycoside hydrolase family 15 protein [Thiobacillaceae bacterium]|nr:glycoside hydrolase family 15 protein [Thiobacillaceae bacterium]